MRPTSFVVCATCVLLTAMPLGAAAPTNSDDAGLNIEALGDREPDRWQGRHHYLYDDEHRPGSATTGASSPSDPRACANEPVRMRRSDGSTVVRRVRRCD